MSENTGEKTSAEATTDRTELTSDEPYEGQPEFYSEQKSDDDHLDDLHDDEITVDGQEVHLNEIRQTLNTHSGVRESGVCGVSHEESGTIPVAFVVLTDEARDEVNATRLPPDDGSQTRSIPPGEAKLVDALEEIVREKLGEAAVPRRIIPVLEMPKDKEGMVIDRVLARLYAGEDTADMTEVQNQKCLASIKKICEEMGTTQGHANGGQ